MEAAEIELKLALEPSDAERLKRDHLIQAKKRGRATFKRLVAVYFDTPDLRLKKARVALRIRREGRKLVQTVKFPKGSGGGLQIRKEYEAVAKSGEPDFSLIKPEEVRSHLETIIGGSELVPIFTTDIRRSTWLMQNKGSSLELVLDRGFIISGNRRDEVCEAELELKNGEPSGLLDFALDLSRRLKFRIEPRTKAGRGFALFAGERPTPARAEGTPVLPGMSVGEAFCELMRVSLAQLMANEAVVLAGEDPEGVHQARVAIRRARAAMSAFRPVLGGKGRKKLSQGLKWLQQSFGPARDLDVFLAETLKPVIEANPDADGLKKLRKLAKTARDEAYASVRKTVASSRYARIVLKSECWLFELSAKHGKRLDAPVEEFAAMLLDLSYKTVLENVTDRFDTLEVDALHKLRIDIKKLRYLSEFYEKIFPGSSRSFIRAAKELQDCLGALNDAVVVDELIAELDPEGKKIDEETKAILSDWFARRISSGRENGSKKWEAFISLPRFWHEPVSRP